MDAMEPSAEREQVLAVAALVRQVSEAANRYADTVRRRLDMAPSDMTALALIAAGTRAGEPLSPGALAQRLRLSASAVTSLVDRLERVGHVSRTPHDRDRRRQHLQVTDSAGAMTAVAFGPLRESLRGALAQHSDADLATAAAVLRDAVAAIERLGDSADST